MSKTLRYKTNNKLYNPLPEKSIFHLAFTSISAMVFDWMTLPVFLLSLSHCKLSLSGPLGLSFIAFRAVPFTESPLISSIMDIRRQTDMEWTRSRHSKTGKVSWSDAKRRPLITDDIERSDLNLKAITGQFTIRGVSAAVEKVCLARVRDLLQL